MKKTTKAKQKPKKKEPAPIGRPTKYRPEYCQEIINYFSIPYVDDQGHAVPPPYFMNYALSIGINMDTLTEWRNKYEDFSVAYRIAKEKQLQFIINNALLGGYNASFAWRAVMNMHEWRDKADVDSTLKVDESVMQLAMAVHRQRREIEE